MTKTSFKKATCPSDLVLANYHWWHTNHSLANYNPFSCYNRNEIINENSYDESVIVELNKYMITNDSQCGSCDNKFSSYHEACLVHRSDISGLSIDKLRRSVARVEQRAYVDGWMTLENAKKLSSILNKSKRDFSYIMFRHGIPYKRKKLIIGDVEVYNDYIPLTTEIVKLASGEEIEISPTNCPPVNKLLEYFKEELDQLVYELPKMMYNCDNLIKVNFIMNEYCEKGLMKKLLDLCKQIK